MAFRDDLEAAHARGDALERRVAELEAENRELRGEAREPESGDPAPIELGRLSAAYPLIVALALFGLAGGLLAAGLQIHAAVVGVFAAMSAAMVAMLSRVVYIIPPGAAAVISGRQRRVAGGRTVGYRIAIGGRVVVMPIIERIDTLDLRPRSTAARVSNAYTEESRPVDGVFRVVFKIAGAEPVIGNAIERFIGKSMSEVERVVRETIEGHIRERFAQHTVDELRGDPERLADELLQDSEDDLRKVGVVLDDLAMVEVVSSAG